MATSLTNAILGILIMVVGGNGTNMSTERVDFISTPFTTMTKNNSTNNHIVMIALSVILLLGIIIVMSFEWKKVIPDVIPVIVGLTLIIFREPFARSCVKSQNEMWGTHFDDEEIERTARGTILFGLIAIVWGAMTLLDISFNLAVSESKENIISGVFFIVIGFAMVFVRDKDNHSIIHFNGKPAMVRIGKKNIYLHRAMMVLFGLTGIAAGVSLLLGAAG